MTGKPLHIAPAPRNYASRKDRSAIIVASVVFLVGAAALALAIYLFAQSHVETPELRSGQVTTPSAEKQTDPRDPLLGGKAYTDRLPRAEETDTTITDPGVQGSAGKSITDRIQDSDEANSTSDGPRTEAVQVKKITDRIIGDMEVPGD